MTACTPPPETNGRPDTPGVDPGQAADQASDAAGHPVRDPAGAARRPGVPPRVCLVGVNGYGRFHLRNLLRLHAAGRLHLHQLVTRSSLTAEDGEAELATAFPDDLVPGPERTERDAARERARAAIAAATQLPHLDAALADDPPDVVVVSTPIHTHADLAARALRAGCDVLLEKPPTASLEELTELLAVEEEHSGVVQVGFQTFGSTALPELRRIVASGEIGELRGVGAVGTWVRTTDYWLRAAWAGRRTMDGQAVVDGVTTNPLAHAVAIALHAAGAHTVDDVLQVDLDQYRAHDIEADDTTAVRVRTAHGVPVTLGLTLCSDEHRRPWVTVQGTEGRATYDYYTDEIQVEGRDGTRTFTAERITLLENLLDHRSTGAALLCALRDTGAFMRVLEAVRTAPDPTPVPTDVAVRRETPEGTTLVLPDVLEWCTRAAEEHATFRELGAPWARPEGDVPPGSPGSPAAQAGSGRPQEGA